MSTLISREELLHADFADVSTGETIEPVTPGEMLDKEFLTPLGMSKYRLAKEIAVPPQRIGEIVAGRRAITADTDLRLCRFFGLTDGWWLRLQADYDTEQARRTMAQTLARIRPLSETTAGAGKT
jgi:antitoxin HigA-1